jgi:hypothetical protein
MSNKVFHTRLQWHNVSVWAIASLLVVLFGLVIAASSGDWSIVIVLGIAALVGLVVTYLHDRSVDATYAFENDRLVLWNKHDRLELSPSDIRDASLVDRTAARTYITQKLDRLMEEGLPPLEARSRGAAFIRFCTVDIGLRSLTFGIGRKLVDTMPNAKHDLVMLRLSNGQDLLLSPVYNQDLMDHLSRLLRP